jgi:hypothetical protein
VNREAAEVGAAIVESVGRGPGLAKTPKTRKDLKFYYIIEFLFIFQRFRCSLSCITVKASKT